MWESISKLGTTPLTLLFAAGLIICVIIMIKKGTISFKGKGLTVGNNDEYGCVMELGFCCFYGMIDD